MKKIVKLIVAVSVVLCCFGASAQAANIELERTEMLDLMNRMGIINAEYDSANDMVSRENFVLYIARMLKLDLVGMEEVRYFSDVEQESYAAAAINAVAQLGYIEGDDNDDFNPASIITAEEACTIISRVIGSTEYARMYSERGRYTQMAEDMRIYWSTVPTDQLCVSDAAVLIARTMRAGIFTVKSSSGEEIEYEQDESKTILSQYWGAYSKLGTVTEVYGGSLEGANIVKEGRIGIGDESHELSDGIDAESYLASYVRYFYYADSEEETGEVFFLAEYPSNTEKIGFDAELLESLDNKNIKWYKDKTTASTRQKNLTDTIIIYNGLPLSTNVEAVINAINKGSVTIKDRDNDSYYDTVIIEDYTLSVVGGVDVDGEIIYDYLRQGEVFKFSEFDTVRIHDDQGVKVALKDLAKDTVLSVKKSAYPTANMIDITVCRNSVSGVLSAISSEDDKKLAVIDGKSYYIDKTYTKNFLSETEMGETYTYYTDLFGDIAYVKNTSSSVMEYGYLLQRTFSSSEIENEGIYLKVLTEKGDVEKLLCADTVKLDGISYKRKPCEAIAHIAAYDGLIETLEGEKSYTVNGQLMRFSRNSDGQITEIDTLKYNSETENENTTLTAIYGDLTTERWFNIDRLGVNAVLNTSTKVFCVPEYTKTPSDNECEVGGYRDYFVSDRLYYTDAYYSNTKNGFAEAVVYKYSKSSVSDEECVVIQEIKKGINEDNEVVHKISAYRKGAKIDLEVPENIDISSLDKGDIVIFNYDVSGNVIGGDNGGVDFEKLFDCSDKQIINWKNVTDEYTRYATGSAGNYRNTPQLSFGYVTKNTNSVVSWGNLASGKAVESANLSSLPIIVCDSNTKNVEIKSGTVADIYDYESVGDACSLIILQINGPTKQCAIVYNY